jgi:hypothetical protein
MNSISDKIVQKVKTHISYSKTFFFENPSVYEIMWENMVEPEEPQVTNSMAHALMHASRRKTRAPFVSCFLLYTLY